MSHIQDFGDAVIHRWRRIILFRDAHPSHEIVHLPQKIEQRMREMWVHLQNPGYADTAGVTLIVDI